MFYNTENGASLQKLPESQIKNKFHEKDSGYYCWKLRKTKLKHQILFRKLLE